MKLIRLYGRVLALLGPEAGLGWLLAFANIALAAAQFAEPVLFGRIVDTLASAQKAGSTAHLREPAAAARGLGRLRAVHHRLRRVRRAACRPAVASPAAGGADRLFRARDAIAARLSRRLAFRTADEGDAHRHRFALGPVAVLLPREFRGRRFAVRAAAAVAVSELAAGAAADRAVRGVHAAHDLRAAQDRRDAGLGREILFRSRRTRLRRARQCGAGAELRARRSRGDGAAHGGRAAARRADAGAVVVGDHDGADARRHHHHAAVDLPARHLAVLPRASPPSARS